MQVSLSGGLMRDVYLLPGIIGSSSQLVELTESIPDISSVHSVSYPGIRSKTELICSIDKISEYIINKIVSDKSEKHIIIIGYSFGGCVAQEIGPILEKAGIVIDCMIIIDAPIPGIEFDFDRSQQLGFLAPRTPLKKAKVRVVQFTFKNRSLRLLMLGLLHFMKHGYSKKLERFIIRSLREGARKNNWMPKKAEFSGLLFFSRQFYSVTSETWRKLCPNMSPIVIDADHLCMMSKHSLSEISRHLSLHISEKSGCRGES